MIIAVRILKLQQGPALIPVTITIQAPVVDPMGCWRCDYEIGWPDAPRVLYGYGHDAVQALIIALQMIGFDLYMSEAHEEGRLWFDRPGSGYGFPVPKSERDLLIGDDARFEV